ncbi:thiol-disulfide oxidoreductase ResA [Macrococcus brunensis]|uniref:Thiol-disulfide oxidoreductase ResA n=1 Tax=Macrococcus brunensis TaxID=198483 RepID=A0A4R6BDN7_9STAP|nr:thiol-disulfide oxidoreductase ResA [Macrococcus brunensis]TDL97838.1 thiol-disulfide oxidoreductase ResA [Macrococcus brunensis]ULG73382.1 thiol-disulfide oxidoreductase ResA [Macrococcus brunensis]
MNKRTKKWTQYIVMTLIALAIAFIVYSTVTQSKSKAVGVGDDAPEFELQKMDGSTVKMSDYKGKGVILNFWGTWCEPCKREMPALSENYEEYKGKNVEVLAIHLRKTPQQVEQFFSGLKKEVHLPVAFDKDNEVADAYGIDPLPTTVVIDKNGKVKAIHKGEMNDQTIKNYMNTVTP